jgi:hypothetical protein
MTAFKELLVGGYVLRFWPSDNGWMCGITPQMMEALQQKRTWVGLTDEERKSFWTADQMTQEEWDELFNAIEVKLKDKNNA